MKYIYTINLPSFEKYELFDPDEDTWEATKVIPDYKGKGIRDISTLYIKGIKRKDNLINKITPMDFFNDYLKLGKELFELSMTEHSVHFQKNYELDIATLTSNYIEKIFWELPLSDLQENVIENIVELREDFVYLELPNSYNGLIWGIIELIDEIIDLLYLLLKEKHYEIDDDLNELWSILEKTIDTGNDLKEKNKLDELLKLFLNCQRNLSKLFDKVEEVFENSEINLKKIVAISNAQKGKIKKINILKKYKESPLIVIFTCDQISDLKNIITEFLKKYGFPYYVIARDEDEYKKYIKNIIITDDADDVIPCNLLILNSIFTYLLYTIITEWKTADEKIKKIWGFDDKKQKSKNISSIHEIRKMCNYFNNSLSSQLYGFKTHMNNNEDEKNYTVVSLENKKEYEESDNYFKSDEEKSDKQELYYEYHFNNLCIVANKILVKDYSYVDIDNESKNCLNCGKAFVPSIKFKNYCCDACKKQGRRKKKTENKRNERAKDKNKGTKGKTS